MADDLLPRSRAAKPARSRPNAVRRPYVDLVYGSVVVLTHSAAARRMGSVRAATAQDLEIAGRRDLASLLPPST